MKRILFTLVSMLFLTTMLNAQEIIKVENRVDSVRNVKDYAGKYLFKVDGYDEVATVSVVNDSILNISAYLGEARIKRIGKDKFRVTEYGGTIEFIPGESNKIKKLKATIEDAGIHNVEAIKEEK